MNRSYNSPRLVYIKLEISSDTPRRRIEIVDDEVFIKETRRDKKSVIILYVPRKTDEFFAKEWIGEGVLRIALLVTRRFSASEYWLWRSLYDTEENDSPWRHQNILHPEKTSGIRRFFLLSTKSFSKVFLGYVTIYEGNKTFVNIWNFVP